MHDDAYRTVAGILDGAELSAAHVLDVGSKDVNGTFKPLVIDRGWAYTGLDIQPGPNVDIVADDPYHYPIDSDVYDVVLSGSTMEHVQAIWRWVPELVRVLRPGGWLVIYTHWKADEHRYPVDCWRIMPDGMNYLFKATGKLTDWSIWKVNDKDIAATARKVTE